MLVVFRPVLKRGLSRVSFAIDENVNVPMVLVGPHLLDVSHPWRQAVLFQVRNAFRLNLLDVDVGPWSFDPCVRLHRI